VLATVVVEAHDLGCDRITHAQIFIRLNGYVNLFYWTKCQAFIITQLPWLTEPGLP
jgi:hypothetical protein